eukprot:13932807-Alexandrium_andersonii.AAC.1
MPVSGHQKACVGELEAALNVATKSRTVSYRTAARLGSRPPPGSAAAQVDGNACCACTLGRSQWRATHLSRPPTCLREGT